jgi:hypothetical protein
MDTKNVTLVLALGAGLAGCSGYSPYDARPCRSGRLKANAITGRDLALESIDSQLMQADQIGVDFGTDRSALERRREILLKRVDVVDLVGCPEIAGAVDVQSGFSLLPLFGVERIGQDWRAVHDLETGDTEGIEREPDPRLASVAVRGGDPVRQGSLTIRADVDSLAPLRRLEAVRVLDLLPDFPSSEVVEFLLEDLDEDLPGAEQLSLESLEGLEALRSVEELRLIGLRKVSSLAPLAGLTAPLAVLELVDLDGVTAWDGPTVPVRSLTVQAMSQLEDLGVPVQADETTPSGAWLVSWNEVRIRANPRLARLSGLRSLRSIRTLELRALPALQDLSDLAGLERATELTLHGLSVRDLGVLTALRSVWSLQLRSLPNLRELTSLHGLDGGTDQLGARVVPGFVGVQDVPGLPSCAIEAMIDAVRPERALVWGPLTVDACTPRVLSRFRPDCTGGGCAEVLPDFMPPLFEGVREVVAGPPGSQGAEIRWSPAFDDGDLVDGRTGVYRYLLWISEQPLDLQNLGEPQASQEVDFEPADSALRRSHLRSLSGVPGDVVVLHVHVQVEDGAGRRDGNTVVRTATITIP